ncbi:MAG: hypothetical protein HY908_00285, partial [Myxococcales bacterium]|nr:hypothetical protein [Myxococcales bacterium]
GGTGGTGGAGGCGDPYECPPLRFANSGLDHPLVHVTMQVAASRYIGGIDRYVFDFTWLYDDPGAADEAEDVVGQMRLMLLDPSIEPDAALDVYQYPADAPPLEPTTWLHTLHGFALIETPLAPTSGFFSIRRVGNDFVGGISLKLEPTSPPGPNIDVSGSYQVPVPP